MHGEDAIFFWSMVAMVVVGLAMVILTEYAFVGMASMVICGGMAIGVWRMNRVVPPDEDGTLVGARLPRPPSRDAPGRRMRLPRLPDSN